MTEQDQPLERLRLHLQASHGEPSPVGNLPAAHFAAHEREISEHLNDYRQAEWSGVLPHLHDLDVLPLPT